MSLDYNEIKVNHLQTPVLEETLKILDKKSKSDFIEFFNEIELIRNLCSPDRKRAKDLSKDAKGRILVEIENPHILENMDFFTERAKHYRQYGNYTDIFPNPAPGSEYRRFWDEERRRCKEGLIRPYDGEWIPGYYYFYLNYSPILKVEEIETVIDEKVAIEDLSKEKLEELEAGVQAERIEDFPDVWDGDYLFFHYVDAAERSGEHGSVLKCRGRGYSFKGGSMLARNYFIFKASKSYAFASETEYLIKDGILSKAWTVLNFMDNHTPFTQPRDYKDTDMHKRSSYKDIKTKTERGFLSEIFGITCKNEPSKGRGKRGKLLFFDEAGIFPGLKKTWSIARKSVEQGRYVYGHMLTTGCVCAGTKVWTREGKFINIENLKQEEGILGFNLNQEKNRIQTISWMQPPKEKECVEFKTHYRTLRCSLDHPILVRESRKYRDPNKIEGHRRDYYAKLDKWYVTPRHKQVVEYKKVWKKAGEIKKGDVILCTDKIDLWGKDELFDPRLVGMLIGDGSYGKSIRATRKNQIEYKSPRFFNCDSELNDYVYKNYDTRFDRGHTTQDGKEYKETTIRGLVSKLKEVGIAGQSKTEKRLPANCMDLTKEHSALLLAGLFDTDGTINKATCKGSKTISITQSSREILEEIKELLEKFGIVGKIRKILPRISENRKDKNAWYKLDITSKQSLRNFYYHIPLLVENKKQRLKEVYEDTFKSEVRVYNTFDNIREERVVFAERIGMQPIYNLTAAEDHTYIANNIITHNTGGEEGADFEAAEAFFYFPSAYNIKALKNVFDKSAEGAECAFYSPEYLNRQGCYDKNGNSDIVKALIQILYQRQKVRNSSNDPNDLVQEKAEASITPQESVLRTEGSLFPIQDLKDYLGEISVNLPKFLNSHYTGRLKLSSDGVVDFVMEEEKTPIREFPVKDNINKAGCIEIFELPKRLSTGFVPKYRYIAGCDPFDDDHSTTNSLGSIFIFDRYEDKIVAEYTGRPTTANEFYETCLRLCKFYNAILNYENDKKGLYGYFYNKNQLHILCDNPEILGEKDLAKVGNNYGNKKKGTNSNTAVNAWGRRLQADWLIQNAPIFDLESEEEESNPIMNLQQLRPIGYIRELIAWHPDIGNADRISAMNMLMILKEDMQRFDTKGEKDYQQDSFDDPFFKRTGLTTNAII